MVIKVFPEPRLTRKGLGCVGVCVGLRGWTLELGELGGSFRVGSEGCLRLRER